MLSIFYPSVVSFQTTQELLVRVLDAPSAEAFQDNSTEAAGPVPAATDRVAASSHRGDVLGDAMSALVALAGCSR